MHPELGQKENVSIQVRCVNIVGEMVIRVRDKVRDLEFESYIPHIFFLLSLIPICSSRLLPPVVNVVVNREKKRFPCSDCINYEVTSD
jgi:hypothetical protein